MSDDPGYYSPTVYDHTPPGSCPVGVCTAHRGEQLTGSEPIRLPFGIVAAGFIIAAGGALTIAGPVIEWAFGADGVAAMDGFSRTIGDVANPLAIGGVVVVAIAGFVKLSGWWSTRTPSEAQGYDYNRFEQERRREQNERVALTVQSVRERNRAEQARVDYLSRPSEPEQPAQVQVRVKRGRNDVDGPAFGTICFDQPSEHKSPWATPLELPPDGRR